MTTSTRTSSDVALDIEAAKARLSDLQQREQQAQGAVQEAEQEVRAASVQMAESSSEEASERFNTATRKLAEAKARAEAFNEQVIPAAEATIQRFQEEALSVRDAEKQRAISEIVSGPLVDAVSQFRRSTAEAAQALTTIQACRAAIYGHGREHLTDPQRNVLGHDNAIAHLAPVVLQELLRGSGTYNQHDWEESLKNLWRVSEAEGQA